MSATIQKITKEIYEEIKQMLKVPADDAKVIAKYGLGKSTVRDIRNTENYQEYCERRFRFHGHPKGTPVKAKMPKKPSTGNDTDEELDRLISSAKGCDSALKRMAAAVFPRAGSPLININQVNVILKNE